MSTNPQGRHRRRALAGTALVTAALLVVAACSSSKKSSSTATTAAASATTAAASTAPTAPATPKTITVTLIGPFTGPFASSSKSIQTIFQYVFDQVNAGTGLIKAPGYTFKLVTNDDGAVASKALDFARTAQSNGSHILNLVGHAEVDAVQPLATAGQVLATMEDPPDVDRNATTYPYSFDFYANNIDGITAQMRLAASKGLKKFAVLGGTGDQYQGYVDDVPKALAAADPGASIVLTQRFDPNTSDFSSIVTKVQQSGADGVWFFATGSANLSFYQAMIAANQSQPIFNAFGALTCSACLALPKTFLSHVTVAFPKSSLLGADGNPLIPAYGQETQKIWQHFNYTSLVDKATHGAGLEDIPYGIVWGVVQAGGDDPAKLKAAYEGTQASGGVSFVDPSVKYAWSSTNHGGFETANVAAAVLGFNTTWPGFYTAAS
jgi:ABC-type branched-subunit amino acid transport system substrate-binding protein